jgi:hypothetical protein
MSSNYRVCDDFACGDKDVVVAVPRGQVQAVAFDQ